MKSINLINNSEVKYKITRFPDGEPHFTFLEELDHKEDYLVICRITSAEDLFILLQINDILSRHGIVWSLYIPYLMSMRMDRVMSFDRPFTLKIVCGILNSMSYDRIFIMSPHSNKIRNLLDSRYRYVEFSLGEYLISNSILVFPDNGAAYRYHYYGDDYILFNKERDLETGRIKNFFLSEVNIKSNSQVFTFIDDLCDGGGTFLGELEILKEKYPNGEFNIIVCHAVNLEGLKKLCDNFDHVTISNSFKDFDYKSSNLTVVDICQKNVLKQLWSQQLNIVV